MVTRYTFQHGPNLLSQLVNVSLFVRSIYIIFPKDPQFGFYQGATVAKQYIRVYSFKFENFLIAKICCAAINMQEEKTNL